MQVILYSTGCPRCEILKAKLEERQIPYEIVTDAAKMLSLGIFTVPYLGVDGKLLDYREAFLWINEQ